MNPRSVFYLIVVSMASVLAVPLLRACMVCVADPMERVLVTELQGSEDVVLAKPVPSAAGRFHVTKVLKSAAGTKPGIEVEARLPLFSTDGGKMGLGVVLLTRWDKKSGWIIRAPASGFHQVAFFQKVLSMPTMVDGEDADFDARRAAFFHRYLHHPDMLLARAAAAEIASAPYPALKAMKEKLDVEKVRAKLKSPSTGERRPLYYTLLGVCGTAKDAMDINRSLDALWRRHGYENLAPLLTAKLELEGEGAVDYIEARYFRDHDRTLPEIEAAVMALRVHGNTDDTISRDRVINAYRSFFDDREPLVFFIVDDLARWKDWESRDRLVAIAEERGGGLPEIQQRVNEYLKLCPSQGPDQAP